MSTFINYCRTCDHQRAVDDVVSGDSVCTDCGLVLDKIYLSETKNTFLDQEAVMNRRTFNGNSIIAGYDCIDIIERMCNKCWIDDNAIKNLIFEKWQKIQKKTEICKYKGFCPESAILVCIYTALIESGVPRPLSHLCGQTNVDMRNAWRYLKANDSFYRPHLMCEYLLHPLELPFKDVEAIRAMVKHFETRFVFAQKTLITSCAYIFLSKKENSTKPQTSISQLAKQLGTSSMAVYRCVKKLKTAAKTEDKIANNKGKDQVVKMKDAV